jgi:GAF domain-containing protein
MSTSPRELRRLHASAAYPSTERANHQLAADLAELAGELACRSNLSAVLSGIAEAAVRLVPGALAAGAVLPGRRGTAEALAFAGDLASACDKWQFAAREGPSFAALCGEVVRIDDLEAERRWSGFTSHGLRLGARSVLAIPLRLHGPSRTALLTMYADHPNAFDDDAAQTASMLALHAAVALERVVSEEQFHNAIESRQLIGQAVGILIERDRLTAEAAFQLLSRTSQDRNIKVRDLAQLIVETGLNPTDIRPDY